MTILSLPHSAHKIFNSKCTAERGSSLKAKNPYRKQCYEALLNNIEKKRRKKIKKGLIDTEAAVAGESFKGSIRAE